MAVLEFIINNILTQAAVVIGLVACLGLVLQKKPANDVLLGTFKTMLGFLVLAAGSSVMQGSLAYFGDVQLRLRLQRHDRCRRFHRGH